MAFINNSDIKAEHRQSVNYASKQTVICIQIGSTALTYYYKNTKQLIT